MMRKPAYHPFCLTIGSIVAIIVAVIVVIGMEIIKVFLQKEDLLIEGLQFLFPNTFIPLLTGIALGFITFSFQKKSLRDETNINSIVDSCILAKPPLLLRIKVVWISFKPYCFMYSLMGLIVIIALAVEDYRVFTYVNVPTMAGVLLPNILIYPEWKKIALRIKAAKSNKK